MNYMMCVEYSAQGLAHRICSVNIGYLLQFLGPWLLSREQFPTSELTLEQYLLNRMSQLKKNLCISGSTQFESSVYSLRGHLDSSQDPSGVLGPVPPPRQASWSSSAKRGDWAPKMAGPPLRTLMLCVSNVDNSGPHWRSMLR